MDGNTALRYSASPSAIGERLGTELAILQVETGTYFGLTGVGIDIWSLLDQSPTINEIVEHLTREYDIDEARCRADVKALVDRLLEARLVIAEAADHA